MVKQKHVRVVQVGDPVRFWVAAVFANTACLFWVDHGFAFSRDAAVAKARAFAVANDLPFFGV